MIDEYSLIRRGNGRQFDIFISHFKNSWRIGPILIWKRNKEVTWILLRLFKKCLWLFNHNFSLSSSVKTLLLTKGADPNLILPKKRISPFHLVIGNDSDFFTLDVTLLILQNGGNPNVQWVLSCYYLNWPQGYYFVV